MAWLRVHAVPLTSIRPDEEATADLEPLTAVLRDVRVVLLGEESHGDGTTFLAKTRLIRFLHERMGFDVLAFESDMFAARKAWALLHAGESADTALRRAVFPIWTESAEFQPLIAYIGEQALGPRPLEVAGFDSQLQGSATSVFLQGDLRAFLGRIGSSALRDSAYSRFDDLLGSALFDAWTRAKPAPEDTTLFMDMLTRLAAEADQASATGRDADAGFWSQMLRSIATQTRMDLLSQPGQSSGPAVMNLRDEQMGRNLVWLAESAYPQRKIIVWAATFHIVHDIRSVHSMDPGSSFSYDGVVTMGDTVARALGAAAYVVGFTAATGEAGAGAIGESTFRLRPPVEGSLEDLMQRAGLENAFVDFRRPAEGGEWLRDSLVSRPLGYTDFIASWPGVLDGVVFTRVMTPSHRVR